MNVTRNYYVEDAMRQRAKATLKACAPLLPMLMIVALPSLAHATSGGGLANAEGALKTVFNGIMPMLKIIAIIAFVGFGIAWAIGAVDKSVAIKWMIGVAIAGSAVQITELIWSTETL